MIYNILEVANTHGGDFDYLSSLIEEFKKYNQNTGIKFQPFKYDEIALPDYAWYTVYEELFFSLEQWAKIINQASVHKDIWIDVFDEYSIDVIKNNLNKIYGIKLQASVLYNKNVVSELASINLDKKKLILNISGYQVEEIEEIVLKFNQLFKNAEILLQIGFQGYPTKIEDSGLVKIKEIQSKFNNQLVFADHIDANDEDSLWLPIFAAMQGVNMIEKHIKHSSLETKYDHYSSLSVSQFQEYLNRLNKYTSLNTKEYITDEEHIYLDKSEQTPVLSGDKMKGNFLTWNDFSFKRTDSKGLNTRQLESMIENGYYLSTDKAKHSTILQEDLNKATVATIIAVRLKSSRLKEKALEKIGDLTSIEYCIKNALKFENVDYTIVATSDLDSDKELENYTFNKDVIFHKGDPDDVIKRYLGIIRKLKVNVFVRVTGDMPFISNEILRINLKSHFQTGADYTVAKEAAVGTNLEIINAEALEKVQRYFPKADYSEYMTWYFQNNPDHFKLNYVDLPKELIRDYRLTLDYEDDLIMFNEIAKYFAENGKEYSIKEMYDFLDLNPEIASINSELTLTYKTDQKLIDTLNQVTSIK